MEEKCNWNLSDIFENKEEFETTKQEFESDLKEIEKYKNHLCDSSDNLYSCYRMYEKALEKLEKLYAFGMLTYHLDMSNQESIKLFKEVEKLEADFGTATSFITPEITYTDTTVIEKYLNENTKLKRYTRIINEI